MIVWFIDEHAKRIVYRTEIPCKPDANLDANGFDWGIKNTLRLILEEDRRGMQEIQSSLDGLYTTTAIITQQYEAIDGTYIIYFRPL